MNLSSKYPHGDSPSHNASKEPQFAPKTSTLTGEKSDKHRSKGREVWRRIDEVAAQQGETSNHRGGKPFVLIGDVHRPDSAARLIDSIEIHRAPTHNTQPNTMESTVQRHNDQMHSKPHIASIDFLAELLATLCSQCETKASLSLIGRIQGKHPGLKALTAWAREILHSSLTLLSLKANNVFEVTFNHTDGKIHALKQADLTCESENIYFSSWRPHFDAKQTHATDSLDHPVWMQIVDLCQVLREEKSMCTIGEQIGQVILIDTSEAYMAKLFGPRIRLLIRDLDSLPSAIRIPRLDGEGIVEYKLEFNGLPNQCRRCRSHDHQIHYCPKREMIRRHKGSKQDRRRATQAEREETTQSDVPPPQGEAVHTEAAVTKLPLKQKKLLPFNRWRQQHQTSSQKNYIDCTSSTPITRNSGCRRDKMRPR
jgi:hypothetical protein